MRSIMSKLILAFLSIGIVSVTIIFITARWNTRQEFIRFLSDQNRTDIIGELTNYYAENGTWVGAEIIWYQPNGHQQPGFGPPRRMPFVLTDEKWSAYLSPCLCRFKDNHVKWNLSSVSI